MRTASGHHRGDSARDIGREAEQCMQLPGYLRLQVSEPRVFQVELRGLEDRKQPHLLPAAAAA